MINIQAKKLLDKKIVENVEIMRFEIKEFPLELYSKVENTLMDSPEFDDPEISWGNGVATGFDNELVWIDLNKFMCWIESYTEENKETDPEDIYHDLESLHNLMKELEPFEEYTLYPNES